MYKDMQLMMDAARQNRVKLPGLETVKEIYELAIEEGQERVAFDALCHQVHASLVMFVLAVEWIVLSVAPTGRRRKRVAPSRRGVKLAADE